MSERRTLLKDVLSIYLPAFFITTGISIISPILSIYAKSYNVSYTSATLAVSIYAIGRIFTNLPMGYVGDRRGRRPVLLLGVLIIMVTAFLCATATSFWELVLYRLLQGLGSSMWQTMRAAMLQDILKPEERGRILGYFQAFTLIGSSAGPTIGGIVAEIGGIRAPFYAYGLFSLVALALSYWLVKEPQRRPVPSRLPAMNASVDGYSWHVVLRLLRNPGYMAACIATFTMFFLRHGLRSTLIPLYSAMVLQLDPSAIGVAISFSTLTNLLVTIPMGYALDRFGRKAVLVPSLLASALVAVLFSVTATFLHLSLLCVLLGVSTGGGSQAPLVMASDATMREPHGLAMGLFRVFCDIGFILGPLLVGVITDAYGLHAPFFVIAGIVFAAGLYVQVFTPETLGQERE